MIDVAFFVGGAAVADGFTNRPRPFRLPTPTSNSTNRPTNSSPSTTTAPSASSTLSAPRSPRAGTRSWPSRRQRQRRRREREKQEEEQELETEAKKLLLLLLSPGTTTRSSFQSTPTTRSCSTSTTTKKRQRARRHQLRRSKRGAATKEREKRPPPPPAPPPHQVPLVADAPRPILVVLGEAGAQAHRHHVLRVIVPPGPVLEERPQQLRQRLAVGGANAAHQGQLQRRQQRWQAAAVRGDRAEQGGSDVCCDCGG